MGRFTGELEDLEIVRRIAKKWGYGNLITFLKTDWSADHVIRFGIPYDSAILVSNVGTSIEEIKARVRELEND